MRLSAAAGILLGLNAAFAAPPSVPDDAVVARLIAALNDPDPEVRQNLGAALSRFGPAAVAPLTEALKSPAPERRAGAAYALALLGPTARSALPELLEAVKDADLEVRRQASYAIARVLGPNRADPRTAPVDFGGRP